MANTYQGEGYKQFSYLPQGITNDPNSVVNAAMDYSYGQQQATYAASKYGTDTQAELEREKLAQEQSQWEQSFASQEELNRVSSLQNLWNTAAEQFGFLQELGGSENSEALYDLFKEIYSGYGYGDYEFPDYEDYIEDVDEDQGSSLFAGGAWAKG